MLRRAVASAAVATLVVLTTPSRAGAQAQQPGGRFVRGIVGVSGGAVLPLGHLTDHANPGWHAQLSYLGRRPLLRGATPRVDAFYADFGNKTDGDPSSGTTLWALVGGLVFSAPPNGTGIRPYLVTGLGVYDTRPDDRTVRAHVTGGIHGGAGLSADFGGDVGLFVEARWHFIPGALNRGSFKDQDSAHMVPITIGVRL